ncbi:hypothetical protein [Priestia megaterium]|uniref:hypothetical protein n=1 Tax=Priestia megaterium TaxID=1404 RepID=UPI002B24AAA5|nr:hypothetical protein [Priestia megaterium]MEB2293323.1 hypothetical protein [Priestia megaterium]
MSHKFDSTNERPWLTQNHKNSKERSVQLGKEAIDYLLHNQLGVTLQSIADTTKKLDPQGSGIHSNTVRTNEELYALYKQHSLTYKQKKSSRTIQQLPSNNQESIDYRRLMKNRNINQIQAKYMKMSKKELVQRLLQAEQYIAENNRTWVAQHFETFK